MAHVIEQALRAVENSDGWLSGVIVASDHESLCDVARSCEVRTVMTSPTHRNGTSRIAEAVRTLRLDESFDFVINLQADQPNLAPRDIVTLARELADDASADIATLAVAMSEGSEDLKESSEAVKVVMDAQNQAMYFSRAAIPFEKEISRNKEGSRWYYHVGTYAYRIGALLEVAQLPASTCEIAEDLEQLRALHAGKTIKVVIIPQSSFPQGIDTRDDYRAFVRHWQAQCRTS